MKRRHRQRAKLHLRHLAHEQDLTVKWVSRGEGLSMPAMRLVLLPKIRSGADYLEALHELGHTASAIARQFRDDEQPEAAIVCEAAAWAWASHHVDIELLDVISVEDWRYASKCFITYVVPQHLQSSKAWR